MSIEQEKFDEDGFLEELKTALMDDDHSISDILSDESLLKSYYEEFSVLYTNFTEEKMKNILHKEIEREKNEENSENSSNIVPMTSNIQNYEPIESIPISDLKIDKIGIEDLKKLMKVGEYKPEMFNLVIKNAEKMATEDYIGFSIYKIRDPVTRKVTGTKKTWFVKAEAKRDVLTTMFNVKIRMHTKYEKIPIGNNRFNVKVNCYGNIYDLTRNAITEGVIASEDVVRWRKDDEGNFVAEASERYPEEKVQTRTLGRLVDMIVPSWVWKSIRDMVYLKFYKTEDEKLKEQGTKNKTSKSTQSSKPSKKTIKINKKKTVNSIR